MDPLQMAFAKNRTMDSTVSLINTKHSLGFTGLNNVQNQVLHFADHGENIVHVKKRSKKNLHKPSITLTKAQDRTKHRHLPTQSLSGAGVNLQVG